MMVRRALVTWAVLLAATAAVRADSIKAADLDLAACKSVKGRDIVPAPPGAVLAALGLGKPQRDGWHGSRHLIIFRRELALGSIFVPGSRDVFLLKPGASPDPLKDSEWIALTCAPRQGSGRLFTLDADTKAKAILVVDRETQSKELRDVRLFADRFHNITPASLAYADREYLPPMGQYIPHPASNIPTGRGHWVNVGKDGQRPESLVVPPLLAARASHQRLLARLERAETRSGNLRWPGDGQSASGDTGGVEATA